MPLDPKAPGAEAAAIEALARAAAAGDRAAFAPLVERLAPGLHRFAARLLSDPAEAEDVTQESFTRLWRMLGDGSGGEAPRAPVRPWLYRTARNLCIDRLRRRGRLVEETAARAETTQDPAPTPEAVTAEREAAADLHRAIEGLPERQRSALLLVHIEGLSGRETAAILDASEEAVESLLARARRSLRAALRPSFGENER